MSLSKCKRFQHIASRHTTATENKFNQKSIYTKSTVVYTETLKSFSVLIKKHKQIIFI